MNTDFKYFIKHIQPLINNLRLESFSKTKLDTIKNLTIRNQKLKNINQLRDKHEGLQFLENTTLKIAATLIVQENINYNLLDLNTENININKLHNLNLNGKKINIIGFKYGELPKIDITSGKTIYLVCLKDPLNHGYLLGKLSKEFLKDEKKFLDNYSPMSPNFRKFIGFEKLENLYNEV